MATTEVILKVGCKGRADRGEQEQDYTFKKPSPKWEKKTCGSLNIDPLSDISPSPSHHSFETSTCKVHVYF